MTRLGERAGGGGPGRPHWLLAACSVRTESQVWLTTHGLWELLPAPGRPASLRTSKCPHGLPSCRKEPGTVFSSRGSRGRARLAVMACADPWASPRTSPSYHLGGHRDTHQTSRVSGWASPAFHDARVRHAPGHGFSEKVARPTETRLPNATLCTAVCRVCRPTAAQRRARPQTRARCLSVPPRHSGHDSAGRGPREGDEKPRGGNGPTAPPKADHGTAMRRARRAPAGSAGRAESRPSGERARRAHGSARHPRRADAGPCSRHAVARPHAGTTP